MTKKILFICTANRMRSATAEKIYQNDVRFEVSSAGTHPSADTVLDEKLLAWADAIVVMEKAHRNFIRKNFPEMYQQKRIVCLYIPDEYGYMEESLVEILRIKFEDVYQKGLLGA
ncbi:MAG TPA: hypothetical protein PLC89_20995 [Haliscomenobacter sp.]|uniref:low molecular weight protein tyrosine phosphatase family protein n=1 Tax=Haliscomenobacter sp. TaxID=2717303 RepID=UPI002C96B845|nr:hypothetical protein [Haliscomenobacter sp.]HOY19804.1 hypothetical protein [Haliscomenobacter sp.]HPH17144.1 hypothetical protein [Haliscomenobacter sp.]